MDRSYGFFNGSIFLAIVIGFLFSEVGEATVVARMNASMFNNFMRVPSFSASDFENFNRKLATAKAVPVAVARARQKFGWTEISQTTTPELPSGVTNFLAGSEKTYKISRYYDPAALAAAFGVGNDLEPIILRLDSKPQQASKPQHRSQNQPSIKILQETTNGVAHDEDESTRRPPLKIRAKSSRRRFTLPKSAKVGLLARSAADSTMDLLFNKLKANLTRLLNENAVDHKELENLLFRFFSASSNSSNLLNETVAMPSSTTVGFMTTTLALPYANFTEPVNETEQLGANPTTVSVNLTTIFEFWLHNGTTTVFPTTEPSTNLTWTLSRYVADVSSRNVSIEVEVKTADTNLTIEGNVTNSSLTNSTLETTQSMPIAELEPVAVPNLANATLDEIISNLTHLLSSNDLERLDEVLHSIFPKEIGHLVLPTSHPSEEDRSDLNSLLNLQLSESTTTIGSASSTAATTAKEETTLSTTSASTTTSMATTNFTTTTNQPLETTSMVDDVNDTISIVGTDLLDAIAFPVSGNGSIIMAQASGYLIEKTLTTKTKPIEISHKTKSEDDDEVSWYHLVAKNTATTVVPIIDAYEDVQRISRNETVDQYETLEWELDSNEDEEYFDRQRIEEMTTAEMKVSEERMKEDRNYSSISIRMTAAPRKTKTKSRTNILDIHGCTPFDETSFEIQCNSSAVINFDDVYIPHGTFKFTCSGCGIVGAKLDSAFCKFAMTAAYGLYAAIFIDTNVTEISSNAFNCSKNVTMKAVKHGLVGSKGITGLIIRRTPSNHLKIAPNMCGSFAEINTFQLSEVGFIETDENSFANCSIRWFQLDRTDMTKNGSIQPGHLLQMRKVPIHVNLFRVKLDTFSRDWARLYQRSIVDNNWLADFDLGGDGTVSVHCDQRLAWSKDEDRLERQLRIADAICRWPPPLLASRLGDLTRQQITLIDPESSPSQLGFNSLNTTLL